MKSQVSIQIRMQLLSDTIFGSGQSEPGGEDIGLNLDQEGYPYLKGSALKGLLRESLEDLLVWSGGTGETLDALMGAGGWSGDENIRHIHISELQLMNKPVEPRDCISTRTFTELQDGIVVDRSLRSAVVANSGLVFTGELVCEERDSELLLEALAGIKRLGTMRSRGFGRVRLTGLVRQMEHQELDAADGSGWFHVRVKTESPIIITDLSESSANNLGCKGYIPATAIRGLIMNALAEADPVWFEKNRIELLNERTRFLDLMPAKGDFVPLPAIQGFFEDKQQEGAKDKVFQNAVVAGIRNIESGLKKANLGMFCALEGGTVWYWNAQGREDLRIQRNGNRELFQTESLSENQIFDGYIFSTISDFGEHIKKSLSKTVWIGADRHAGFGKCEINVLEQVSAPLWEKRYGYADEDQPSENLYMLALSPFSMIDESGMLCGIDESQLAARLGISSLRIENAATGMTEFGTYNRIWGCRSSSMNLYDRGSLFKLSCEQAPTVVQLRALECSGIGCGIAEGLGQILFIRPEILEQVKQKRAWTEQTPEKTQKIAAFRRARIKWILANEGSIGADGKKNQISKSQLGEIQRLCEKAIENGGNTDELKAHLEYNLSGRQVRTGIRFQTVSTLIETVLETPLRKTLGVECSDSMEERLRLLCALFDFSRKEG